MAPFNIDIVRGLQNQLTHIIESRGHDIIYQSDKYLSMQTFKQYVYESVDSAVDPEDPKIAQLIEYFEMPPFNYKLQDMAGNQHARLIRFVKHFTKGNVHHDGGDPNNGQYFLKGVIWSNSISISYPALIDHSGRIISFDLPEVNKQVFLDMDPNNTHWLSFGMKIWGCSLDEHFYSSESGVEEVLAFYDKIKPAFEAYNAYANYPNPDDYVGRICAWMNGFGLSRADQLRFKQRMGALTPDEIGDEDMLGLM